MDKKHEDNQSWSSIVQIEHQPNHMTNPLQSKLKFLTFASKATGSQIIDQQLLGCSAKFTYLFPWDDWQNKVSLALCMVVSVWGCISYYLTGSIHFFLVVPLNTVNPLFSYWPSHWKRVIERELLGSQFMTMVKMQPEWPTNVLGIANIQHITKLLGLDVHTLATPITLPS